MNKKTKSYFRKTRELIELCELDMKHDPKGKNSHIGFNTGTDSTWFSTRKLKELAEILLKKLKENV